MPCLVPLPAKFACDHEGCDAELPVKLILLGTGTIGVQGSELASRWQIAFKAQGLGPYVTYCPKHHIEQPRVQAASVIPDAKVGGPLRLMPINGKQH